MTPLRLLLLSVLLVGAGVGLWVISEDTQDPEDPTIRLPEAGEDAFLSGAPLGARRITIEHPRYGQRVRAELGDDGRWRLTEPLQDAAEPMTVQAVMSALWTRDWKPAPPEWEAQDSAGLGLTEPEIFGEVLYENGDTEVFQVGAADAGGRWYACMLNEQLLALGNTAMVQLKRPGQQWRDHRIQPYGIAVYQIEWTPQNGTALSFQRRGSKWYLTEPSSGLIDEGAVQHIARLLGARAEGLGDTKPGPADEADRIGVLKMYAGDGEELRLELWPRGLTSSDRDYLMAVTLQDFKVLGMDVEALLSKQVLDFESEQIQSIRAMHGDRAQDFRLRNTGWTAAETEDYVEEVGVTVQSLLDYAAALMRTERLPVPEEPPSGRLIYSISRTPSERGSVELRWWVAEDGTMLVGAGDTDYVTPSTINFEAGVSRLLDRF